MYKINKERYTHSIRASIQYIHTNCLIRLINFIKRFPPIKRYLLITILTIFLLRRSTITFSQTKYLQSLLVHFSGLHDHFIKEEIPAKTMTCLPKHPVIILPGIVSSTLEVWQGMKEFRTSVWGKVDMLLYLLSSPNDWCNKIMLDPVTGLDPKGVKVRPANGVSSSDYILPFYWVWQKMITNLGFLGYDHSNFHVATYDWRLDMKNLEVRDRYFTKLKYEIEMFHEINNNKVVIMGHSLGNIVFLYFMSWVEERIPGFVDKHIHAAICIGAPFLGSPKSIAGLLSGESRVSVSFLGGALYDFMINQKIRKKIFNSWGSVRTLLPKGGSSIWMNNMLSVNNVQFTTKEIITILSDKSIDIEKYLKGRAEVNGRVNNIKTEDLIKKEDIRNKYCSDQEFNESMDSCGEGKEDFNITSEEPLKNTFADKCRIKLQHLVTMMNRWLVCLKKHGILVYRLTKSSLIFLNNISGFSATTADDKKRSTVDILDDSFLKKRFEMSIVFDFLYNWKTRIVNLTSWKMLDHLKFLSMKHVNIEDLANEEKENVNAKPKSEKYENDIFKFVDPLKYKLPNAPNLKIYCFYGTGRETERGYYYKFNKDGTLKIDTSVNSTKTNSQGENYNKGGYLTKNGVVLCDGDGTIPVISCGYMPYRGWRNEKLNPSNIKTIIREYKDEATLTKMRGGPKTAEHVDILGNYNLTEDVLKICCGLDEDISDRIYSNLEKECDEIDKR